MKNFLIYSLLILVSFVTEASSPWILEKDGFVFRWDLENDKADLENQEGLGIWSGSMVPGFWLIVDDKRIFIKPNINLTTSILKDNKLDLELDFGALGTGKLLVEADEAGLRFTNLQVQWNNPVPLIMEMYVGVTSLSKEELATVSDPSRPFSPDWASFGYCIPGAKEGPAQSFFRFWDFGQADISLGSFGPSMGTPYGAAFPRPTLMASLGSDNGWITFGAGSVPDAPMTLQLRNGRGCLQFLYREDLWGKGNRNRQWKNLLNITFARSAWEGMRDYVNTITVDKEVDPSHHMSVWNTWGNWKTGNYAIKPITDFAKTVGAEVLVLDDPWESFYGSATYNKVKFPTFHEDIEQIHKLGLDHGIWETLAWIDKPEEIGLTADDLILDRNGTPCKGSWNFDPFGANHFILDISSENARKYLIEKTQRVIQELKPRLIKLDFGYGISNPNVGVPRNPEIRGERYCYELTKLIVDAARGADPNITIMYYAISPFFLPLIDIVSLDDQGDLSYENKQGHDQWSIWASLISMRKTALNGSSSYDWDTDDEVLLNTIVLGSPGSVLPNQYNGHEVPDHMINRRFAVNNWYRRSIQWEPLWLNSNYNGLSKPMKIDCWGRVEIKDSKKYISALVLRGRTDSTLTDQLNGLEWEGRWAIISQSEEDVFSANNIVLIPFDNDSRIEFPFPRKPKSMSAVNYKEQFVFEDWEWTNGKISLKIDSIDKIGVFLIE